MIKLGLAGVLVIVPLCSTAQPASVLFANGSSVGTPLVMEFDGAGVHSAAFVAQLLYSTDRGTSFTPVGIPSPFFNVAVTSVRAGVWHSQSVDFPAAVQAGTPLKLKVAVWDSTIFSSFSEAIGATTAGCPFRESFQFGITGAFNYTPPTSAEVQAQGPAIYAMSNFPGLTLSRYINTGGPQACPEPSALLLGALGVSALVWRRR